MSGTFLQFPKTYEIDEMHFSIIACFIRHEFMKNRGAYQEDRGLVGFAHDLERYGWDYAVHKVVDMGRYCAPPLLNREFLKCLGNVRQLLVSFGEEVPEEYAAKLGIRGAPMTGFLGIPVGRIIYYLDQLARMVEAYEAFGTIQVVAHPP